MTNLVCPLCGRHLSLAKYDPSSYDDDVYGVEVTGLGRGRGFSVSERYSLLSDEAVMDVIKARCRRILYFAEGVEPPPPGAVSEVLRINKEWAAWGAGVEEAMKQKDSEISLLRGENANLKGRIKTFNERAKPSGPSIYAVRAEELQRENERWRAAYINLEAKYNSQATQISNLSSNNQRLTAKLEAYQEASTDDDSAAAAEMEELLERINDSSDTDYDNLSDAVDFLLEE